MTTRTWAEDKVAKAVTGYQWNGRIRKSTVTLPAIAAKLLQAEHARAVRIVKRHMDIQKSKLELAAQKGRVSDERLYVFALAQLETVMAALQRGRTTRRTT
jgi:hypothetical protein